MIAAIIGLLSLVLTMVCYSLNEVRKWRYSIFIWRTSNRLGFWGQDSWERKYKLNGGLRLPPRNNWYYRFYGIRYREKFLFSASLLVWLTDGHHFLQFWMFNFMATAICSTWNIGNQVVTWLAVRVFISLIFSAGYEKLFVKKP